MISELNSMYFYSGYIRKSDLVVHMRFHSKERAYKCNHCEKQFFQSGIKLLLYVKKKNLGGGGIENCIIIFQACGNIEN